MKRVFIISQLFLFSYNLYGAPVQEDNSMNQIACKLEERKFNSARLLTGWWVSVRDLDSFGLYDKEDEPHKKDLDQGLLYIAALKKEADNLKLKVWKLEQEIVLKEKAIKPAN